MIRARHILCWGIGWAAFSAMLPTAPAGPATVSFDVGARRALGGDETALQRDKFFTVHSDFYAGGLAEEDLELLVDELGVGFGRVFMGPFDYFMSKEAPYPSGEQLKALSAAHVNRVLTHPLWRFRTTRRVITDHPYLAFSMDEDPAVAAAYAADFFETMYADEERPEFYEPMNEPFVHAKEFGKDEQQVRERMALFFKEIGKAFDERGLSTKVVGYASAWPSMELWDFKHWKTRMKMFMDTAGDHMDGISVHLYDGTNVTGQDNHRSGSNSEAILDLIETYSFINWGRVKPLAITEYGDIPKGFPRGYSDLKSSQELNAFNHILFTLLDREDRIDISVPFITSKSSWHYNEENGWQAYGADLWRPDVSHIENGNVLEFIPTIKFTFYELWAGVQGDRIMTSSDDPDIRVHGFVDGSDLFLALNNLIDTERTVALSSLSPNDRPEQVLVRRLYVSATEPAQLTEETLPGVPDEITMKPHETVVFQMSFAAAPEVGTTFASRTYYSTTHLQPIEANQPLSFGFDGVQTGSEGMSMLRMSLGRKHGRSKQPVLVLNGTEVPVPDRWAGYDQANREDFFGAIEIPVPVSLIKETTDVQLTFPDDGGHVSSLVMVVDVPAG